MSDAQRESYATVCRNAGEGAATLSNRRYITLERDRDAGGDKVIGLAAQPNIGNAFWGRAAKRHFRQSTRYFVAKDSPNEFVEAWIRANWIEFRFHDKPG